MNITETYDLTRKQPRGPIQTQKRNMTPELAELKEMEPCQDGWNYCKTKTTLHQAWNDCPEPAWMIWYSRRKSLITKEIAVRIAIFSAREVLPIFAKKYPNDNRPLKAIEAAEAYLL